MAIKYVSPSGSNSNNGNSLVLAYQTPAYAITNTSAGDTIYFDDGTYTWIDQTVSTGRIFSAINFPTPFSKNPKVIFDGGSVSNRVGWSLTGTYNYYFYGMKFKRAKQNSSKGCFALEAASMGVYFQYCDFTDLRVDTTYDRLGIFSMINSCNNSVLDIKSSRMYKNYRINPAEGAIGSMLLGGYQNNTINIDGLTIFMDGTGSDQFTGFTRWNSGTLIANVQNASVYNGGDNITDAYFGTTNNVVYTGKYGITNLLGHSAGSNGNFNYSSNPFVDTVNDLYDPRVGSQNRKAGKPR